MSEQKICEWCGLAVESGPGGLLYSATSGSSCYENRGGGGHKVTPPKPLESPQEAEPELVSFCNHLEEPQEATGTSCEVFIPVGSPGISWERPALGTRPDIVGVRHLEDGSTEYLMHNEALCDQYYVGRSPDMATTQGERCEHGVWAADHCWQCGPASTNATKPVPTPAPQAEGFTLAEQISSIGEEFGCPAGIRTLEWIRFQLRSMAILKKQAGGLCDGCSEELEDAFCRNCVSAAQAPLLQKIAELEKKLEDYRLTFRAIEREAKRKEARVSELEAALESKNYYLEFIHEECRRTARACGAKISDLTQAGDANVAARQAIKVAQPKAEKVEER